MPRSIAAGLRTRLTVVVLVAAVPAAGVLLLGSHTPAGRNAPWLVLAIALGVATGLGAAQALVVSHVTALFSRAAAETERSSEAMRRQALLIDTLHEGVLVTDADGRIVEWNPGATRLFGYSREEVLGRFADMLNDVPRNGGLHAEIVEAIESEGRWEGELAFRRKDGSLGMREMVVVAQYDAEGRRIANIGVNRDITDRWRAQEALRHSEAQYRLLFESNPHPMWVYDPGSLRFLAVNDTAVHAYGYSRAEFLAMTLADIRPEEDLETFRANVASSEAYSGPAGPWRHRRRDGSTVMAEITGHETRFQGRRARLILAQDVTARVEAEEALRRSEEQLRQAQKMEAVGRLAGGIAHDFNNLLTAIRGNIELTLLDVPEESPLRESLQHAYQASETASSLTRRLLSFTRGQPVQRRVVDLNEQLLESVARLRRQLGAGVELRTRLSAAPTLVRTDPAQIEQLLTNLALNARDAMPDGGLVEITTEDVEISADQPGRPARLAPGRYIRFSVRDTGHGMDETTRARVFEPFFSTREKGKGTGLGLFTVYGIVEQNGGHIRVESRPGEGAAFHILLPRAHDDSPAAPVEQTPSLPGGSETVLLVEDEPPVRLLTRRVLQRAGYRVIEACDGVDALELSQSHDGPIDLMLTDLTMPRMGGRELAQRMAEARPGTRIVFMSGFADDGAPPPEIAGLPTLFIRKPFTLDVLTASIRGVLDAPVDAR